MLALGLTGCSSGQTGSADCAGPSSCVCDSGAGGSLLRVQITQADAEHLEVTVVEPLSLGQFVSEAERAQLAPGAAIAGALVRTRPCSIGLNVGLPAEFTAGSELLVDFSVGDTAADGAFGFAVPWQNTLEFGMGHSLPSADVSVLFDVNTCLDRFPANPVPPCDDTVSGFCAQAPLQQSHRSAGLLAAFAAASIVFGRRHQRKNTSAFR